MAKNHWKEMF